MTAMEIRRAAPEDARGIGRVQIDAWNEAYKGIVPDTYLGMMDLDAHEARWQDNLVTDRDEKYTIVLDNAGTCAGFLTIGPPRDENAGFDAELWALYIHPDHWRGGHGAKMFEWARRDLVSRRIKNLYVWALKDNQIGRDFYEKMGAQHISSVKKTITIEGFDLVEVIYGWLSL